MGGAAINEYTVRVFSNGYIWWFQGGVYHREDGPAVIEGNTVSYWHHGALHRLDGPAVITVIHGSMSIHKYYIEGVPLSYEQFKQRNAPVKEMTMQQVVDALGYNVKIIK